MCGIAGILLSRATWSGAQLEHEAERMSDRLVHRGPDGSGVWADADAGIALGHRRLSVIDLSATGAQPMTSADGRWVLTYNGELYNHRSVRRELECEGVRFRGTSDSEVFVELIALVGVRQAMETFDGMVAAAVWDRKERCLWLLRDRFGEKPLYVAQVPEGLLFASEVSAFAAMPSFSRRVDETVVSLFVQCGHVPAPWSIYADARKLPPATMTRVDAASASLDALCSEPYWDPCASAAQARASVGHGAEAFSSLEAAFGTSVRRRLEADVPLGAFFSGGIDSSAVVGEMCAQSNQTVRTFTVSFGEADFDEAPAAAAIARHLGTDHTEIRLSATAACELAPTITRYFDEPFADSSALPTRLIAAAARDRVTVALTGDGGDELFAGYNRHIELPRMERAVRHWPTLLRRGVGHTLKRAASGRSGAALSQLARGLPLARRIPQLPDKLTKAGRVLLQGDLREQYAALRATGPCVAGLTLAAQKSGPPLLEHRGMAALDWLMLADTTSYLPDDILVKVDRACMSVSLETRTPFLSAPLFDAAWALPDNLKVADGRGKIALRRLAERYIPHELLDRPKAGFAVPLAAWLRGPLAAWAGDLLAQDRLRHQGMFDAGCVQQLWQAHASGEADHAHTLWALLMFQSWQDQHS